MSLEAALLANTTALTAHTDALNKMLAAAKGGAAAGAATTAAAAATAATGTKAGNKAGGTKGPKAKTEEDLRTAAGNYLATTDKAERDERKALVKKLSEHYEVAKLGDVPADKYAEVIGHIETLAKGELPDLEVFAEEAGEEDEGLV